MTMDLVRFVMARQQKLEQEKEPFIQLWQDVADYVCPYRDELRPDYLLLPGHDRSKKIFDGTAMSAAVIAADGIHGYHISPAFPWFKYTMNRRQANKLPEVRQWLEETEYNMYTALTRSNFYSEGWKMIYDGFTISTAPFYTEEDVSEGRIICEAVHPGEIYIAENRYGEVDVLHRKRRWTARKLVQKFGEKCPVQVQEAAKKQPFEEFEFIHAVYPREEYDRSKMDEKNKKYASVYILNSAGNVLLGEKGFDEFPFQVWRYLKTGRSPYGTGPALLAMPTIKNANVMTKTMMAAAQRHVEGVYQIPAYLDGKVNFRPGSQIPVEMNQGNIQRVDLGSGTYPIGQDREADMRRMIKEAFHVDTFLMLNQMSVTRQMTATEVDERMKEKAAVLGAELGPLNEVLDKILDRIYEIEFNAGRMPQPPDVLLEMKDQDPHLRFDPVYMGPLAQAQRERFQDDSFRKFFVQVGPIVQSDPGVLDNFDMDAAARLIAENSSLPGEIVRPEDAVARLRQQKQQAAQAEMAKQDLERLAAVGKDASTADKNLGGMISGAVRGAS